MTLEQTILLNENIQKIESELAEANRLLAELSVEEKEDCNNPQASYINGLIEAYEKSLSLFYTML